MWPQRFVYAVQALIVLASQRGTRLSSAKIAAAGDIPHKYLESILVVLRNTGIVESSKGPNGGYLLAADPSTIHLLTVFDALEVENVEVSVEILESITADLRENLQRATIGEAMMREQVRRNRIDYVI